MLLVPLPHPSSWEKLQERNRVAYIQRTSSGTMKMDRGKELSKAATCCVADKNHNKDGCAPNAGLAVRTFDI
jgi:hypothetical protein